MVRGRYAPSPTGPLHIGNALAAVGAWLSARAQNGQFILRVEDLDPPRTIPGCAEEIIDDLRWLGLDWDEGPDVGGPFAPYSQSDRLKTYDSALRDLASRDRVFPCSLSRRELAEIASAPSEKDNPYPVSLRPNELAADWFDVLLEGTDEITQAVRFKVPEGKVTFNDLCHGLITENVRETCGDFVLKRRDNLHAYQLAVVVDDCAMDVTEVVRGNDLLSSTARQILLHRALNCEPPVFGHLPLLVNDEGKKLSKRNGDLTIASLRDCRATPESVVGFIVHALGLAPNADAISLPECVALFDWAKVPSNNVVVDTDQLATDLTS